MPDIIPIKQPKHCSSADHLLHRCKGDACWRDTANASGYCRHCLKRIEATAVRKAQNTEAVNC